jgi:subtilisin-like proprotein convertase family protein
VAASQTKLTVAAAPPAPHVVSATASGATANSISSFQVTFNTAIALSSFTKDNASLLGPNGRVACTGVQVVANTGDKTFTITFPTQTTPGTYTLYVGSNTTDLAGDRTTLYQGTFKIAAPTTASYTASTPVAISPGTTAVSLLNVPQAMTIGNVTVKLNISYPEDRDLYIHLQAPDGTDITLANQMGGTSSNFTNTVFSDSASQSIGFAAGPFTGTYKPIVPLSNLAGKNSQGTWKLWVQDVGSHSGTLDNWALTITAK